jgi:hypothetical protein
MGAAQNFFDLGWMGRVRKLAIRHSSWIIEVSIQQ